MKRSFGLGILLVAALATTSAGQQPLSPAAPIHIVPKGVPHVLSRVPGAVEALTHSGPSGAQLVYYGGPIISNVKVEVVFWGSNVNTTVTAGIAGFYAAVTNSAYYDVASEYSTKGVIVVGRSPTNQILGRGSLDNSFTIAPSICNTSPCTIYNDQIQAELRSQINAGHLPSISTDSQGFPNTLYMIYFPPGVSINDGTVSNPDPNGYSCVQFCGYHGTGTLNSKELLYGVLPDYSPGSGCDVGCGGSTLFNNMTMVSSHELMEAATDPGVGLVTAFAPPLGWYDRNYGEAGDICNQLQVSSPNAAGFSVQLIWSNVQNACADGPPQFHLSAPPSARAGVAFTVTVTAEDTSGNVLSNYRGTVHFSSSDPRAILPPDGSGSTFQVTLNTPGSQTISVQDAHTLAMIGSAPTSVTSGTVRTKQHIQVIF